ncbi:MAG: hypothetical protein ACAI34_23070 [Verrucomicrobium sp.]|nr:hypothetical protein [Verrucomicrobium sp.]
MQGLGQSQSVVTPPTIDLPPLPPTPTSTTGSGAKVGSQTTTTKATTPQRYPGLTAKSGSLENGAGLRVLSKEGLANAFGISPSKSAKAKTFFASGFNKIANGLGYAGVRKSDFVELTKAADSFAKAKANNGTIGEQLGHLRTLKDKLESHQLRHAGKLQNGDEVLKMVKVEMQKLEILGEIEDLNAAPSPRGKTAIYASLMSEYDTLAQNNPENFSIAERKQVMRSLLDKVKSSAIAEGEETIPPEVHKTLMKGVKEGIQGHAGTAKTNTLLRNDGDVMLSKPHAFLHVNDHLKDVVTGSTDKIRGEKLEVNPAKMTQQEIDDGAPAKNRARLVGVFEGICDSMGISSDKATRDKGVGALPQELCDQAKCLHDEIIAAGHGEAAARKAVASLIMLKLVCPMLMAPQGNEASPVTLQAQANDADTQRSVILVAKMLQNLANEVTSNGKEEYMKPLNQAQVGRLPAWMDFVGAVVERGRDIDSL